MDVHFHINGFTYNHKDTEMYLMTFDRNDISQCIFHIDTPFWHDSRRVPHLHSAENTLFFFFTKTAFV